MEERTPRLASALVMWAFCIRPFAPLIGPWWSLAERCQAVALGGDHSRWEPQHAQHTGGDDQRLTAAGECLAEGLDGSAVGIARASEVARESDLVLEGEVDDSVRREGSVAQGVQLVERACANFNPSAAQTLGSGIGASERDHLVPCPDQLRDQPSPNPTRCSGHENTHEKPPEE